MLRIIIENCVPIMIKYAICTPETEVKTNVSLKCDLGDKSRNCSQTLRWQKLASVTILSLFCLFLFSVVDSESCFK